MYISLLSLFVASAAAYTLNNVTISSTDSAVQYYPPCSLATAAACQGAWWKVEDSRFMNGVAMTCGDPTKQFGLVEPFFHFTFRGSGIWLYQWLNASSAAQNNEYNGQPPFQNLTEIYSSLIQPSGELVPVLTWSLTGLDPLQEHTIGVEHFATPGKNTFITFDYMIVSQSTLDASEEAQTHHKSKTGAIVGGTIGAVVAIVLLYAAYLLYKNRKAQKAAASASKGRYNWQATVEQPATLKFVDPSSEIEASERIAREGRLEEELEKV